MVQCASVAEIWGERSFATGVQKFKGDSFKEFLLFMKAWVSKKDFMVFLTPSLETVVRNEQVYPWRESSEAQRNYGRCPILVS